MDMGYLATAEKFQLDEKTIKSIWNTWSSQQQDNIALPEHIGLHHIWIAGGDRILITDVQRNTLIEILPITSPEAVLAWIRARNYQDINTAMIGFDVDLRDLIKMINPMIEIRISRP